MQNNIFFQIHRIQTKNDLIRRYYVFCEYFFLFRDKLTRHPDLFLFDQKKFKLFSDHAITKGRGSYGFFLFRLIERQDVTFGFNLAETKKSMDLLECHHQVCGNIGLELLKKSRETNTGLAGQTRKKTGQGIILNLIKGHFMYSIISNNGRYYNKK